MVYVVVDDIIPESYSWYVLGMQWDPLIQTDLGPFPVLIREVS